MLPVHMEVQLPGAFIIFVLYRDVLFDTFQEVVKLSNQNRYRQSVFISNTPETTNDL